MTVAVIILSILVVYLAIKLMGNEDSAKAFENRKNLLDLLIEEKRQGKINLVHFHILFYFFHPDFRSSWDYVPPERREYALQMNRLDSQFWKYYKIKQDFNIPVKMVYELYKEYVTQHIAEFPNQYGQ